MATTAAAGEFGTFYNVRVGDAVTRILLGPIQRKFILRVTHVSHDLICCDGYRFDRRTGTEISPKDNWGPPPLSSPSFLVAQRVSRDS